MDTEGIEEPRSTYTQEMYEADKRYKERERQDRMHALDLAITVLEGHSSVKIQRHVVPLLRSELERLSQQ